jgi:sirohydrochlorin cobaltochelatase
MAPATERPSLLIATHGVRGGPGVAAEIAPVLERAGRFAAVRVGCHKAEPDLDAAVATLPPGPAVVAPLLMAEGWIFDAIRARLAAHPRAVDLRLAPALGAHPGLWRLAERRALALAWQRGWRPAEATLLLAGHGTSRHPEAAATTRAAAGRVAARGRFARVLTGFLDQEPELAAVARGLGPGPCVAVGFFVDNGPHGREDVAEALAEAPCPVAYTGALGADAALVPFLLDRVAEARPVLAQAASAGSARSRERHMASASA